MRLTRRFLIQQKNKTMINSDPAMQIHLPEAVDEIRLGDDHREVLEMLDSLDSKIFSHNLVEDEEVIINDSNLTSGIFSEE